MDVKKLSIVVEQKGIAPTSKNLDSLAKASDKAAPAVERLSSSLGGFKNVNLDSFSAKLKDASLAIKDVKASTTGMADMAKNIAGLAINLTNIANATDRLSGKTKSLDDFTNSVRALKNELTGMKGLSGSLSGIKVVGQGVGSTNTRGPSVDPETKAQQRLMQQLERTAMMAGRTKSEYLALRAAQAGLSDQASPFIARIKEVESRTLGATMSTKQYNAALRMVPAQFTDIATQLAGGQNPMLILMQQGGQLKDMFGGVGGALKAVGAELLKLLKNPLVLLAAAITTVGYSFYSLSKEIGDFNKASIASNGIIGLSTQGFYDTRDAIAAMGVSRGVATEALNEIAKSGQITADRVLSVGISATQMSKVTGVAIKDTVAIFEDLQKTPLETINKLDKSYNLLTYSMQQQIKSLVEQGKQTEATALAQDVLTKAIDKMAKESESKLTGMEWLFKKMKDAANSVVDSVRNIMSSTDAAQIQKLNNMIAGFKTERSNLGDGGLFKKEIADLETQRDIIQDRLRGEKQGALRRAESLAFENKLKEAGATLDKMYTGTLKEQNDKLAKRNQLEAAAKVLREAGKFSADDETKLAQTIADLDKKENDKANRDATRAQKKIDTYEKESDGIKGLITAEKERQAALQSSDDTIQKQAAHLATLVKWQEVAANSKVSTPERDHAKRLAEQYAELVALENTTIAIKAQIKAKEDAKKVNDDIASIQQKNIDLTTNAAEAYALESMQIGMTTKERAAALAVYNVEVEKKKALLEIDKKIAANSDNPAFKKQYEDIREQTILAYNEKARLAGLTNQLNEKEMSWYDNLTMAAKQYTESLGTQNQQVQSSFIGIFGTVESALTDFVSNTKTSFKDLTVSVLKQLAVMFAKIALTKAAMAGIGLLSGLGGGSFASTGGSFNTASWGIKAAKGHAFTSSGIAKFASGGSFTNSVVKKATPFAFASGGVPNLGVMGEKPGSPGEAVMPLARTSSGDLGVKTSGTGGVQNNVSVNVTINQDGSSSTSTQSDNANSKAFGELMARKAKEVIAQEQRPGGLLSTR